MSKVLLVEPDRLLADTYRQAFERQGHQVMMCAGAQSAIYGADKRRPDVVVLELQLIGHSGIEFLYEFRSYVDWQTIPVIILTNVPAGEFSGSWEFMREELGVQAYHYKPLTSLQTLISAITEALVVTPQITAADNKTQKVLQVS
jgi:DNA-binding response OmpR family regulator